MTAVASLFGNTLILLALIPSLASCSGKSSAADGPELSQMRLLEQIDGWSEVADSYTAFDASNLYSLINGGAQIHVDNGLVQGFVQHLKDDQDHNLEVYVEKFATAEGAQALYTLQADGMGDLITLPSFGADTASAGNILGGSVVYAHMGNFYFSLTLTGYATAETGVAEMLVEHVEIFLSFFSDLV